MLTDTVPHKNVVQEHKPQEAPSEFTVYEVNGAHYVFCPKRKRAYKVDSKPEEVVRQWWLYRLKEVYGYSFEQIGIEESVLVGSAEAKKKADIVVYTDSRQRTPKIFVEVKKPKRFDGIEQLKVYMNATGCRLGVWSNGGPDPVYLLRIEPNDERLEADWRELRNVPRKSEKLSDVDSPLTRKDLKPAQDFLSILKECENYIKAHEGATPFDEIFKLIFTKLFDERANLKNSLSAAQFRIGALESPASARERINELFDKAKTRWAGVFDPGDRIQLLDESLAFCISALQTSYLLRSDADVLGSAFEVMINPGMKGDKGQYFTPRHVIDLAIDVLQPEDGETIYDPACGSGGFLIGAMDRVYQQIEDERDDDDEIIENKKDYASEYVFGMDFDRNIARVAKAYMLIWGDGRSNIAIADGLNEDAWPSEVRSKFLSRDSNDNEKLREFDMIATNPPFAGDIGQESTLSKYELAFKPSQTGRSRVNKLSRDKLYLERIVEMLKPGGRAAIVIPRGLLKNYNDEYVRRYLLLRTRIVAVVGLSSDMFKPFTNTKTCLVFLEKRYKALQSPEDAKFDAPTVFCVTRSPGKNKSGQLVRDDSGAISSDLVEIADFIRNNSTFAATAKKS